MSQKEVWEVELWEYEEGWGSRLDSTRLFDTITEAKVFQKNFNSRNNEKKVPSWYMVARNPVLVA